MARTNDFPKANTRHESQFPQMLHDVSQPVSSNEVPETVLLEANLIQEVENEIIHDIEEIEHGSPEESRVHLDLTLPHKDNDARYVLKDGEYYVNVFDFFQKLGQWFYNSGYFSVRPE